MAPPGSPSPSAAQPAILAAAGEERSARVGDVEMNLLSGQTVFLTAVVTKPLRYVAVDRDARSGSTKRCAAAVGQGSTAVQLVHAHLAAAKARTG